MNINVYTNTARFDGSARALTEDEMRSVAPSIFAATPHESRSDKFRAIPTIEVLRGLQNEGFSVVGAKQSVSRLPGKALFTKHLVRLRRLDEVQKYKVGDTVFEMLLKNANDGTAAYDLMAGLFRIACLNSMVAMKEMFDSVKVRHAGDVTNKVIEGTFKVLEQSERALEAPRNWSQIGLSYDERLAFGKAARVLRVGDDDTNTLTADKFIRPRRQDDTRSDLWTTFNVVQENVIKGGIYGTRRDANNHVRHVTTREIKGIDQSVKLNQALWTLADEMAKIKLAA